MHLLNRFNRRNRYERNALLSLFRWPVWRHFMQNSVVRVEYFGVILVIVLSYRIPFDYNRDPIQLWLMIIARSDIIWRFRTPWHGAFISDHALNFVKKTKQTRHFQATHKKKSSTIQIPWSIRMCRIHKQKLCAFSHRIYFHLECMLLFITILERIRSEKWITLHFISEPKVTQRQSANWTMLIAWWEEELNIKRNYKWIFHYCDVKWAKLFLLFNRSLTFFAWCEPTLYTALTL